MLRGDEYERPIGVLFDTGGERRIAGHLKLKRGDLFDCNVVSIADDKFGHVADGDSLHGISKVGRVSLLDCVGGGMLGTTGLGDFSIHYGDVSFRYALFGKQHVAIDEKCIRGIQFTLEGLESSVFMHDKYERFGHLHDPDEAVLKAIEQTRPEHMKGKFVKGQAMVSYFTGDWDFLPRFETVLGTVHVARSMQVDFFGRSMEDTPRITVDFDDAPTTLQGALEKMREIRQFFAWMMGYVPRWKDVVVSTSRLDNDGLRSDADGDLDVFGPNEWTEVPETARQRGTLIDASLHPDHFMEVMAKWLARNGNTRRKSANTRFFGCIGGTSGRFIEDGIVSAANTFDLLPTEDKPETQPLPDNIQSVLKDVSEKVKDQMDSGTQRQDVLNTLGRIRKNKRLRDIVEHRANIVLNHFGADRLEQLNEVIGLAVKCRNYYTHGPDDQVPGNVDYADFGVVHFLTETLEFIFGASELLSCGWDPSKSVRDEWHPIGGYVRFYDNKRSVVLGLK